MINYRLKQKIRSNYYDLVNSIAFYPIIISFGFGILSFAVIFIENLPVGKEIVEKIAFLSTKDPDTARTLLSTLIGGMLSLTVFSFSMVMIVLSQAASNYSPKILDGLVKEKHPQYVLGFYLGSIIFYIPLLLSISDLKGERSVFAIGILASISLAIFNVFLFIYFIAHVSNSIKPSQIVKKIYDKTFKHLQEIRNRSEEKYGVVSKSDMETLLDNENWYIVKAKASGYYQDIKFKPLLKFLTKKDLKIKTKHHFSDYILKDSDLFSINKDDLDKKTIEKIQSYFIFYTGESINENFIYGLRQLMEIAVKALSPGINDPGTAKLCINMISDIMSEFIDIDILNVVYDKNKSPRILLNKINFEEICELCFDPIRQYGKQDKSIGVEVLKSIQQIKNLDVVRAEQVAVLERHERIWLKDIDEFMDNNIDKRAVKEEIVD